MPAGLGGGGYLAVAFETTMGTYVPPTDVSTVFVPIISESLAYQEDKYYAPHIRQQTIESEVKPSYYSVSGDIVVDVDTNTILYFLYASRHTITKSGVGPYDYLFVPSQAGSASTGAGATVAKTLSISVVRNGIGFGYAGCVAGSFEWTIEDGVLRCSIGVVGLSEETPAGNGTPAWVAPELFGADAHSIYIAAAAASPTFGAADVTHNGFTATVNYNAEPQNRIRSDREASYVSFGMTEAGYDTELDFESKTEYDNFKASTKRAIRLESLLGGATFALSTDAVQITFPNSTYDTYEVGLGGMGDLIMAGVTGRALGISGGNAVEVKVKSAVTIT